MRVTEILRALRRKHGYSLHNVADELGIAYSTYQGYEKGNDAGKIQVSTLEQIAKFYNKTLVELLTYEEEPGTMIYEPTVPYSPRNGRGVKVLVELDGLPESLEAWFGKLRRINAAL